MGQLDGKRVLLTGGLGTLGQAQARKLAGEGAEIVILDRPDSENAAARCAELGANVSFLGCDLNDLEAAKATVQAEVEKSGGFDVLINNAALIINRPFEEFSLEEYEDQIRVNSSAAFALVGVCAPAMKEKGWGKIINFTSVTLKGILDGYVPYVASKGAMLGLTKSLARELGPFGICVNAVAPGAIVSDAEARVFGHKAEEYSQWVLDQQCLKTRIEAPAVANLVAFLASQQSDAITGQNIGIDGGW
ncbi:MULTISPECIES: SDR family oxidoreductase [Halocynthiibacter]|uniref:SDR family oxidoreductase n=1 Tax=Halocynthiibacter halioticoli TaxID=2986804 RepID=A0AAE3J1G6_9RHOB|nr:MULTISPECIES: SDR family oxidoreductase [Halocynthiibacter]MCV6824811.1 SDR family oxidoreductase [Halocynthiibacter halioticoli]MCW4057812.1 SDR family oxidoreductase [Halocynthiibacter sp. SDUM655004]